MSAVTASPSGGPGLGDRIYKRLTDVPTWAMWLLVAIWTIPNLSLLVNSVRGLSLIHISEPTRPY